MAGENTTEQVIIEFVADTSDFDDGIKRLETLGKIDQQAGNLLKKTNAEFVERNKQLAISEVRFQKAAQGTKALVSTLGDLDAKTKSLVESFIHGFLEQSQVELKQAKDELEKFRKKTEDTGNATEKLKKQLSDAVSKLAQLRSEGKQNSAQYQELALKAAGFRDSLQKVNKEIDILGSDTFVFDGLIEGVTGVAAGFSLAQGALALFGSESEETQKILLKVNASMAILQGLQQISNTLSKESAAVKLIENTQQKIAIAQTNLEIASQSKNIIVKGAATAAQWALNAAMSANPIGAVITAILLLTTAIVYFTGENEKAAASQAKLNASLDSATKLYNAEIEAIKRRGEMITSDMEANGNAQSEILREQQNNRLQIFKSTEREIDQLRKAIAENTIADTKAAGERLNELEQDLEDQKTEIYIGENNVRKAFRDEQWKEIEDNLAKQKEAADKAHADELKRIAEEKAAAIEALEQQRAGFEIQQLNISNTSDEWKKLQVEIEKVNKDIALIEANGNKAALALAKLADETRKLLLASVEQSEQGFTDTMEIEGQKRITITSKNLNLNKNLTDAAKQAEVDAFKAAEKEKQDALKHTIEMGLQTAQQVASILQEIGDRRAEQQLQELERQRDMYAKLREDGKITEKEERDRLQQLEREEKRVKRDQAVRAKSAAIFEATINTALAITRAIPNPVLMALAGALGAINIALIASRPIPQFFTGKKKGNNYEGPATMSEHGAEIIERNGRMYLEPSKVATWVNRDDIIYNAAQTRKILDNVSIPNSNSATINAFTDDLRHGAGGGIDYARLGREIARNAVKMGLNVDENGFKSWVQSGNLRTEYLNKKTRL